MNKFLTLSRYLLPRKACVGGPKVATYERCFAEVIGAPDAVAFMKGRLAFYAALKALGISSGDEVIMPGYTCMVVPAAVIHLGARPVYVDIEPTYCTLDPNLLEAAITTRTKAVLIQHTYGWPNSGIQRIAEICRARGVPMLEDCCHALGTMWRGRHVGTLGLAGFFSSQWSKPYTTGLGGLLVCSDRAFAEEVRRVREAARMPSTGTAAQLALQGMVFQLFVYPASMAIARRSYRWVTQRGIVTGSTGKTEYMHWHEDQFLRMSEAQAAAGICELDRLAKTIRLRQELSGFYVDALGKAGFFVPGIPAEAQVVPLRFPVRVGNKHEVLREAERRMVEIGDWFVRPLHSHLAPQEQFGYRQGMCIEGERAAREIINLPVHHRVSLRHARKGVELLKACAVPA